MFCKNCGKEIDNDAVMCPHCGTVLNTRLEQKREAPKENNTLAIVGLVLAFFIPLAGLICSIMGLKKSNELNGEGHGMALAGLIISIVEIVASVILFVAYGSLISAIINGADVYY